MPIYAYKCESCGYARDVLQKLSDVPLTDCPQCGASSFKKQLTAAGFQLRGSGWYVTDFRGGNGAAAKAADTVPASGASAESKTTSGATTTASPAPAAAAPSAASAGKTSSSDAASKAS